MLTSIGKKCSNQKNKFLKPLLFLTILLFNFFGLTQFSEERVLVQLADVMEGVTLSQAADFDGDGDQDVVIGSRDNEQLGWRENLGDVGFGPLVMLEEDLGKVFDVEVFDVDNDGDVDIVASFRMLTRIVWFENEDGVFGSYQSIYTHDYTDDSNFAHSDIDFDGDIDIVLGIHESLNGIKVVENNGGGVFLPGITVVSTSISPISVSIGDIDGDGFEDILAKFRAEDLALPRKLSWFKNLGDNTYGSEQVIGTITDILYGNALLADLDGDGDLDAVTSSSVSNRVAWFENDGTGDFGSSTSITDGEDEFHSILCADMDGDGDIDVVGSHEGIGSSDDKIVLLTNTYGTGSFSDPIFLYETNYSTKITANDMDVDGDFDVLYNRQYGEVGWLENSGTGMTIRTHFVNNLSYNLKQIESFDVNKDGLKDLVFATTNSGGRLFYYQNAGGGNFLSLQELDLNINLSGIYTEAHVSKSDLNNDSLEDLIFYKPNPTSQVSWFESEIDGLITPEDTIFETAAPYNLKTLHTADIDGNGYQDLVLVFENRVGFANNFGDYWSPYTLIGAGVYNASFPYDVDDDGDIDILSTTSIYHEVRWFENLGDGTFADFQFLIDVLSPLNVQMADINEDGIGDIIVNTSSKIYYYKALGDLNYAAPVILQTFNQIKKVIVKDLDMDGDLDILGGSHDDDKIAWFENLGSDVFGLQQIISTSSNGVATLQADDFDNDGDIDLVATSDIDQKIAWYENLFVSPYQARGEVFVDFNENGLRDVEDVPFPLLPIDCDPENTFSYTYLDGRYFMNFNPELSDLYEISPSLLDGWHITSDSNSFHVYVDEYFGHRDSLDFGLYPDTLIDRISTNLVGGFPRCNTVITYWLDVKNIGTTIPSGNLHLELDPNVTYQNATVEPDSIVGSNVYWNYSNLFYFEENKIQVQVLLPDFMLMGDTLTSFITASVDSLGETVFSTTDTLAHRLVCAYDPNDKIAEPAGIDSLGFINIETNQLEYTIRFQNTGTDTAINVVIVDQLDPNLDWSSFTLVSSSHPMIVDYDAFGEISFKFDGIMLPDSNTNEFASHGFVKYRIDIENDIEIPTTIRNFASIYFDANPAVITNTILNTLYDCQTILSNTVFENSVCANEIAHFYVSDTVSNTLYTWELDWDDSVYGPNFTWDYDTTGTFALSFQIENDFCTADTIFELLVYEEVLDTYLDSIVICLGDSVFIFTNYQVETANYSMILSNMVGCDSVVYQHLTVMPNVETDLGIINICEGDSILLFGEFRFIEGLYSDTLSTIDGCDSVITKSLEINDLIPIDIEEIESYLICLEGEAISLSAIPSDGEFIGDGMLENSFYPELAGIGEHMIYYYFENDSICLSTDSVLITVTDCLGLNANLLGKINIHPNPFSDYVEIRFEMKITDPLQIVIFDALGQIVYRRDNITEDAVIIEHDLIGSGIFFVQVNDSQDRELTKLKIVGI